MIPLHSRSIHDTEMKRHRILLERSTHHPILQIYDFFLFLHSSSVSLCWQRMLHLIDLMKHVEIDVVGPAFGEKKVENIEILDLKALFHHGVEEPD